MRNPISGVYGPTCRVFTPSLHHKHDVMQMSFRYNTTNSLLNSRRFLFSSFYHPFIIPISNLPVGISSLRL
jgi:hypothetical protein